MVKMDSIGQHIFDMIKSRADVASAIGRLYAD
jgi:hypothetical protein